MNSQITIWVLSNHSSDIREFSPGKAVLSVFICLLLVCVGIVSGLGYKYYRLTHKPDIPAETVAPDTTGRHETIAAQKMELEDQRRQIQAFAGEIQALKEQLSKLGEMENQIRRIAGIDKSGKSSGIWGSDGAPVSIPGHTLSLDTRHTALIREMHHQARQIQSVADKKRRDLTELTGILEKKKQAMAQAKNFMMASPSIRPVPGKITSPFGYRKSPFTGKRIFHSGVDISNRMGTSVVATADGTVTFAGRQSGYGKIITIDHGYGKSTQYAHLKDIRVHVQQQVRRGETIGSLGNTGRTTGPHLHYEVLVNGVPVNPSKYMLD